MVLNFGSEVFSLDVSEARYLFEGHMLFNHKELYLIAKTIEPDFEKQVEDIRKNAKSDCIDIFGVKRKRTKEDVIEWEIMNLTSDVISDFLKDVEDE